MSKRRQVDASCGSWVMAITILAVLVMGWPILRAISDPETDQAEQQYNSTTPSEQRPAPEPAVESVPRRESSQPVESERPTWPQLHPELSWEARAIPLARPEKTPAPAVDGNIRAPVNRSESKSPELDRVGTADEAQQPDEAVETGQTPVVTRASAAREEAWLASDARVRRWTIDGTSVVAEFVEFRDNKVILKNIQGEQFDVPPQQLSKSDCTWYRSILRPVPDPARREQLRRYRAARSRSRAAARRANQRNAMLKLEHSLREQRRAFRRSMGQR